MLALPHPARAIGVMSGSGGGGSVQGAQGRAGAGDDGVDQVVIRRAEIAVGRQTAEPAADG